MRVKVSSRQRAGDNPPAASLSQHHRVEVVKDPGALQALQPDWDGLYQRADRPYLSASFEWAWCAWETLAKPRGGRLHCLTIREGSRLVLVWPLFILRRHHFWKAVLPLNMTTHEPKWSKYSPGNLLLRHTLQWALNGNCWLILIGAWS